ncbi:tRNA pseudouridine synthase D [Fomitiporia mediterranea MF3/22]|uniref:tRNA pseudouridine synthase D n=1 Tax=Fomitiporia mediterranea (strain MF3/22) TaxID=694068 RepID=UPI0004408CF0|nr:tRNA pseudouridine synthase D [Fomitiporia mediterranea MF3/22]EJD01227.1 tRNA pseudouridine synthase D [Fomitiporia mediterranea MF3/22]
MDVEAQLEPVTVTEAAAAEEAEVSGTAVVEALLPPSRALLGPPPASHTQGSFSGHTLEYDVGISEYISKDLPPIHAIIKQRFTDFLVHEVNLDGEVIHIQSLEMPSSETKKQVEAPSEKDGVPIQSADTQEGSTSTSAPVQPEDDAGAGDWVLVEPKLQEQSEATSTPQEEELEPWPELFTTRLSPYLSESLIAQLKQMYLEGPEPPFKSDSGWAGRQSKTTENTDAGPAQENSERKVEGEAAPSKNERGKRGKRGKERGGQGRGGRKANKPEDPRKVVSDPMESKSARTALHSVIRDLFGGKLESSTDTSKQDEDGRVVITWARSGQGRDAKRGGRDHGQKPTRGNYPPYIHFTLQKTNRDNQDALNHLSRLLHCSIKDLSVAGTKDKRGVTVQRVALRRGNKTVEDVWKMANGYPGRRSLEKAVSQRGERGVRVADFKYGRAGLDLGMLKGNTFIITLRNVRVEPLDTLDKAMESLKHKGFINYYGMQRFGTASIPTHSIGLAFLQCDWKRAADLILRHRPGEHPDVVAARDAWLIEKNLDKALSLFPRRVVAERCILESFKKMKGDTRNVMGALSTIPRNLRLMYVHAYQSYVWNAIVSERIRMHGAEKPVVGDLVYEQEGGRLKLDDSTEDAEELDLDEEGAPNQSSRKQKRPWVQPQVKTLSEEDVDKYTIFDVIMPLPGKDVAYPGGALGERYREFLKMDGLDPDNFSSKHKDYNLTGAYRKIILKPKDLSWTVLRYTDPDVPLAQSDEDKLLGMEPPVVDENGKFVALQVNLQLSTAAYATMALREITKAETSSHYQTSLTRESEDQAFRGRKGAEEMET